MQSDIQSEMYRNCSRQVKRLSVRVCLLLAGALAAPVFAADVVYSPDAAGWVRNDTPHEYAEIFLDGDVFSSSYQLTPAAGDVGKQAELFLVAKVDKQWFMHDGRGFKSWPGADLAQLQPWRSKTLEAAEIIPVIQGKPLFAGKYTVYAGYRTSGGPLVYSPTPLQFAVQAATNDKLLRFRSEGALESFLKHNMETGAGAAAYYRDRTLVSALESSGAAAGNRTSTTNLQTSGVDEADTVKVSGTTLYMLKGCAEGPCLETHVLDSATASSSQAGTWLFNNEVRPDGMYLVEGTGGSGRTVVTVAGQNSFWAWFSIWGWSEGKTTLEFLDAADPAKLQLKERLELDGALVASRRVGDSLYLVTRYTPALEEFQPYAEREEDKKSNAAILARTSLPQLLPAITDNAKGTRPLVDTSNCYLPASAVDSKSSPSLITVTSISLQTAKVTASTCFLGDSETLYMTPASLYLATTSWDYGADAADALVYTPNHTTSIHKFALDAGNIVYRGSGEVGGHLGWSEDKKSVRMGENGEYLNVVTSVGDSWGQDSSTRLTVLRESAAGSLDTVSILDGIGKPGEQLYAARFIGERAYLVTFRVTDPLYVVDLSQQAAPRIVGELEINGYSEYLHPVSETLLLGIGKDAVAETTAGESGEARGAWYQGVKVALFDVSNPAAPQEIDAAVLGRRGTESDVLWDHHAFTWLPAQGSEPARFAIPVQLHERIPTWEGFDNTDASSWYDYTHTALYSFEVSASGVTQVGSLIADVAPVEALPDGPKPEASAEVLTRPVERLFAPYIMSYADRSVLADDAVYYLHSGKVLSSFWGESK